MEFVRCQVEKGALIVDALCATVQRPENPLQPNGKQILLQVAKFPARHPEPAADALTIIQGGPGMSSIDLYLEMRQVFAGIRNKRDILVIDQRGTGRSNMLTCPTDDETAYLDFDPELTRRFAEACLEQLDSDPRYYTTSVAVEDLEAVRQAAGYSQLSIYGVSYGTRVAQHYLRRFPDQTRAMILDGVADVGLNLAGGEIARRSQQAFDRMVARCNLEPACDTQFGDIAEKFATLLTRLDAAPVELSFAHPSSGLTVDQTFTKHHLLGMVRLMPYSTESLSLMPLMISQAHAGNFVPLAAQALLAEAQFTADYAYAMNNAVVCTEDAPFLQESDLHGEENTYFGTDVSEAMQVLCDVWPAGVLDDAFREPFKSDIPALLLSGENDPITPPENAARALRMFSAGQHLIVPGHGHGVIARGCIPKLAQTFIETGDSQSLAIECVNREQAQPFFITPAGPTP